LLFKYDHYLYCSTGQITLYNMSNGIRNTLASTKKKNKEYIKPSRSTHKTFNTRIRRQEQDKYINKTGRREPSSLCIKWRKYSSCMFFQGESKSQLFKTVAYYFVYTFAVSCTLKHVQNIAFLFLWIMPFSKVIIEKTCVICW
jgi:hypothetical protein